MESQVLNDPEPVQGKQPSTCIFGQRVTWQWWVGLHRPHDGLQQAAEDELAILLAGLAGIVGSLRGVAHINGRLMETNVAHMLHSLDFHCLEC